MCALRIKGLVKEYNRVRRLLEHGLPPGQLAALKAQVQHTVSSVNGMCRSAGMSPTDLPGPSRNAWCYLRDLDFSAIAPAAAGDRLSPPPVIRIKNLISITDGICLRMWMALDQPAGSREALEELRSAVAGPVCDVAGICARRGGSSWHLEGRSRQCYAWLKHLDEEGNFRQYVDGLRRARTALLSVAPHMSKIYVAMPPTRSLWRAGGRGVVSEMRFSPGFAASGDSFWRGFFGAFAAGDSATYRLLLRDYSMEEDFQLLAFDMESNVEDPEARVAGTSHDLEECFRRVNDEYFAGRMVRPTLRWSRTPTLRTFGHYQFVRDLLTISASLDSPEVPEFLVDFLMYHELLHKQHGLTRSGERRYAHTAAFRRDEKKFARYAQAKAALEKLARTMRG